MLKRSSVLPVVFVLLVALAPACDDAPQAGGADAAPVASTLGKFCNFITVNGEDATVTLEIGGTTLQAATGTCSAQVGEPCTTLPVGEFPVRVLANGTEIGTVTATFSGDKQYVLGLRTAGEGGQLVLKGAALPDLTCQEIDPLLLILGGAL